VIVVELEYWFRRRSGTEWSAPGPHAASCRCISL